MVRSGGVFASRVATCKLSGVKPVDDLADTLRICKRDTASPHLLRLVI